MQFLHTSPTSSQSPPYQGDRPELPLPLRTTPARVSLSCGSNASTRYLTDNQASGLFGMSAASKLSGLPPALIGDLARKTLVPVCQWTSDGSPQFEAFAIDRLRAIRMILGLAHCAEETTPRWTAFAGVPSRFSA